MESTYVSVKIIPLSHSLQIKRHLCAEFIEMGDSLEETVMRVRMQCYGIFA